jgi:hypothetical protein
MECPNIFLNFRQTLVPQEAPTSLAEVAPLAGPVAVEVANLLDNEEVGRLPVAQRGRYVADRMVGATVAQWSKGAFRRDGKNPTPRDVLATVESAVNGSPDAVTWQQKIGGITRSGGVRVAAALMAQDARTGSILSSIGNAVHEEDHDVTLRSPAQLEGYLYGMSDGEFQPWQAPILKEVRRYVDSTDDQPTARWQHGVATSLRGADNEYIRENQKAWDEAASQAREAGVDMDMIVRSADAIRAGREQEHSATSRVAQQIGMIAVPQPTFDHMFH